MAVELLALSKFKLQLLALISEARDLRERERSAREDLQLAVQRQKQSEAEYARRLQELRAEVASRDELQHKLETKVRCLEDENELLEKKEKDLKESINSLLQSREAFISRYEDSTYSLRCLIDTKDKMLAVLSEKIHAHLLLFDSIEKEAAAIRQVVDNVQRLMNQKEQVVTELKGKMGKISTFEKDFVEKIHLLEIKITDYQDELRKRDSTIVELREHLKAEKINSNIQPQIEELRKALLIKEEAIQNLTSEKQALHFELHNLEFTVRKIHDTVVKMSAEDQKVITSALEGQEVCEMTSREEHESSDFIIQATREDSPNKNTEGVDSVHAASPLHPEHMLGDDSSCKKHALNSCLPKPSICPSPQSECSNPPSNILISIDGNMGNCTSLVHRVDSENSATGVEAFQAVQP